jgi:hypothetical protein
MMNEIAGNNSLTRKAILTANDGAPLAIDVADWGGTVYVRRMSGAQRRDLYAWSTQIKDRELSDSEIHAYIVAMVVCDRDGAALFSAEDVPLLMDRSAECLRQVAEAGMRYNGLAPTSREESRENFRSVAS